MDCNTLKILLVEDNLLVSFFEKNLLTRGGYDVVTAVSGEEALDFLAHGFRVDLVLMDVDLGDGITGVEAASFIKTKYNLPIVFYTGHDELDLFLSADNITDFGFIPKNACKTDVIEIINNVIFYNDYIKYSS